MSINIEVRKRQLQSLDQYINSSKKRLQSLIRQLGWNAKQILEVITSNYSNQLALMCLFSETRSHSMSYKSRT